MSKGKPTFAKDKFLWCDGAYGDADKNLFQLISRKEDIGNHYGYGKWEKGTVRDRQF
jgi:hypothetical protein